MNILKAMIANRGLVEYTEATRLETADISASGKAHTLIPQAANAWHRMKAAAARDGVSLIIVSAFRSIKRQTEIIEEKRANGQTLEDILKVCAPPGFSEHHTGRAIDIGTAGTPPLTHAFETTDAFLWLQNNADSFGFRLSYPAGNSQGYDYEPWHWCFSNDKTHRKA